MRNDRQEIDAKDSRDIEQRLKSFGKAIERNLSITDRVVEQLSSDPGCHSDTYSSPDSRPHSFTRRGGMSALQKFSVGTLAATVLFVLLYSIADSRLTFAQVVASVQRATSYSYDLRMNMQGDVDQDMPQLPGKFYWQAPDSFRSEDYQLQLDGKPDPNGKQVRIFSRSKKGIELDTRDKTYVELLPFNGRMSPFMMLQNLSDSEAAASKRLGGRVINGIQCTGFEVALEKIDRDTGEDGKLEVWIDNRTRLPQQVSISQVKNFLSVDLIMDNCKWNEPLDQELFSVVPPSGYSPKKRDASQQRTHEQVVEGIVDVFRLYAEFSGGKYPQVQVIYGDVMLDHLYKFAGISLKQYLASIEKDRELINKDKELWNKYSRISVSTRNWAEINGIMRHDASATYNGLTVGPKDKEKVLFKWRRDDGKDQVIYGDLRVDVLTP